MTVKIMVGDVREKLRELPDGSVHCCVTSPPYWGLRDYGHDGQIGLERTPDEFVAKLVEVFREVRRVLRDDGTLWVNIGDSYATGAGKVGDCPGGGVQGEKWRGARTGSEGKQSYSAGARGTGATTQPNRLPLDGLKPKDLVGVPWLLAFALRADGWFLRQDIIWSKPNPMPESVLDRCTKAHEYIFLLSKSERYFYDAAAIAEPTVIPPESACNSFARDEKPGAVPPGNNQQKRAGRASGDRGGFDGKTNALPGREAFRAVRSTRNKRSVWTITTKPYRGAHFATFPPELPELCIGAGTSSHGVCPHCGAPWSRVTESANPVHDGESATKYDEKSTAGRLEKLRQAARERGEEYSNNRVTVGWSAGCQCPDNVPTAARVLDPFGGAGTTSLVAERLGRDSIFVELNPQFAELAKARIWGDAPLLTRAAE